MLNVIFPNGGEQFEPGDIVSIQWSSQNVQNIRIDVTTNGGLTWDNISLSVPASQGQFNWLISSQISSTECLIKICDTVNPSICDQSNGYFTIVPSSSITVLSPNGGEVWQIGSVQEINWLSDNVIGVKIDLSLNNGVTWITIADSTPSTGVYIWEVQTSSPSIQCLIKVTDLALATTFDVSDDIFEIETALSLENDFKGIPDNFTLIQNFPNPFNPTTKIYYGILEESFVTFGCSFEMNML